MSSSGQANAHNLTKEDIYDEDRQSLKSRLKPPVTQKTHLMTPSTPIQQKTLAILVAVTGSLSS